VKIVDCARAVWLIIRHIESVIADRNGMLWEKALSAIRESSFESAVLKHLI
jgi:hypothetical protein